MATSANVDQKRQGSWSKAGGGAGEERVFHSQCGELMKMLSLGVVIVFKNN